MGTWRAMLADGCAVAALVLMGLFILLTFAAMAESEKEGCGCLVLALFGVAVVLFFCGGE